MKPKIVTILGARPQFVKAAVLSRIIAEKDAVDEVIIHTGQHYDENMSEVFFREMYIPKPKYFLNINGLSHGAMTGQMLEKIEQVLENEKPQAVVVYGDTNSTLAGALAAKKMGIKLVHIEAGLRSFNMAMPEEINRILTDRIADLLLCPTQVAVENLQKEGFENFTARIVQTGDIMKDAVGYYSQKSAVKAQIFPSLALKENEFVLATIHRQENTDSLIVLKEIFRGLDKINQEIPVVLPLHPRTRKKMQEFDIHTSVKLIDPVGYFDMLELLKNCRLVITDSGGLQKEAFFNQKQVIIARTETEWVELVNNGWANIVGHDSEKMWQVFQDFSNKTIENVPNLYGNNVGTSIYNEIWEMLNKSTF